MANGTRPIFERYPDLKGTLPFIAMGQFPTPVSNETVLGEALGLTSLWLKRDDVSGENYGGNKVRKLEFLLAEAKAQQCTSVVTFGGLGSNHALATAIACRQLGLTCGAVLTPEPATDAVRRHLRYHALLGTRIEVAHDYTEVRAAAAKLKAALGGAACYEIPFGGSSWIGAVGFLNAALELAEQIAAGQLPEPDIIYMACGTAGSAAGLAQGMRLAKLSCQLQAVQVTPDSLQPTKITERLFTEMNHELHDRCSDVPELNKPLLNVEIRNDQLGEGYALPTPEAHEARTLFEEHSGLPMSLTYTAKALAGLIADARAGKLSGKQVLFWNTYNSRPYPDSLLNADWKKLPAELHNCFTAVS